MFGLLHLNLLQDHGFGKRVKTVGDESPDVRVLKCVRDNLSYERLDGRNP